MATHDSSDGGDPDEAVRLAQQACKLIGRRDAVYQDTLAISLAAAGRFAEATATAKEAWQLAQSAGQQTLANNIHMRLQLYRDQKPYREPIVSATDGKP